MLTLMAEKLLNSKNLEECYSVIKRNNLFLDDEFNAKVELKTFYEYSDTFWDCLKVTVIRG